jgi:FKBP-type peptidyl-prolyl cis-trans isomerase FklB
LVIVLLTGDEMNIGSDYGARNAMSQSSSSAFKNKKQGDTFLTENVKKSGVKMLPSGLQYKVLKEGDGSKPKVTDKVTVNYTGKLINGKVFDSSMNKENPASFKLNQVIKGWTEGLQKMKVGSKYELYVPPHLGYGKKGTGGMIGPNETLTFQVELLGIEK